MRIANFKTSLGIAAGIVQGDQYCLLRDLLPGMAVSVDDLFASGDGAMERLRRIELAGAAFATLDPADLCAPVLRPQKFLAIGMNYRRHLEEVKRVGIAVPERQYWFNKQVSCITGPYGRVLKPRISDMLDFEVELALVIGRRARHVKAQDALGYVAGYTVCNDLSIRDWQRHTPTFTLGKSYDTHGPIGPWIVTADEVLDPQQLRLTCHVNGVAMQDSETSDMVYSCAEMIEYLSSAITLEPGDVIATGTPEGVGATRAPPVFLKAGDVVRCEVVGIGHIENVVVREE